jgi:hypothetical protein
MPLSLEVIPQLDVVVDLAVHKHALISRFIPDWLVASRNIDDGKSPHAKENMTICNTSFPIGPAVHRRQRETSHHGKISLFNRTRRDNPKYSAHEILSRPRREPGSDLISR